MNVYQNQYMTLTVTYNLILSPEMTSFFSMGLKITWYSKGPLLKGPSGQLHWFQTIMSSL